MSCEIPNWLEDAVRRCKEGDERVCEVVKDYLDLLKKEYLQCRSSLTLSTFVTILAAVITILFKIGMVAALIVVIASIVILGILVVEVERRRKLIELLYGIYIDPRMDNKYLIIGAIIVAILCLLAVILAYM
ncbi:MAG: hypothetical protein GXO26_00765 [Crenarchaeota archaeon]|nr:hypothetical protein [Thermoproteota archaeon]